MKRLVIWLISLLATALLLGCADQNVSKEGAAKPTREAPQADWGREDSASGAIVLSAEAIETAGIQAEEARRIPMQSELKVPGTVTNTAQGRAVVTPPVDGKIVRLVVSVGDQVRAGQPVATLQSSDLAQASASIIESQMRVMAAEAAVREAKAEVALANARLGTAKTALRRQEAFARTGAFSQPSLQQATRDLNEAESELESALKEDAAHEAALARAERLFELELISKAELEAERLHHELDHIRVEKTKKIVENARKTLQRETTIASKNLLNTREIQMAEAEVHAATLAVQQAKIRHQAAIAGASGASKGLQAARAAYNAQAGGASASGSIITVVAPIAGVVTQRGVSLGQAVERTSVICEIEDLRSVWVTASVPEKQVGLTQKGARAEITVSAFPGRIFTGVVQVIGSRLNPKSRTMPVQILVDNRSGDLRADMFASVAIGVGPRDMALAVPESAITDEHEAGRVIVFVQEAQGRFMKTPVKLGRRRGGFVEIVKGLDPGAKIVVKGAFVLMSESKKGELKGEED